jgi:hypothetical protein
MPFTQVAEEPFESVVGRATTSSTRHSDESQPFVGEQRLDKPYDDGTLAHSGGHTLDR